MFYPHTIVPSLFRQKAYCLLMILWMGVRFNRQGTNKAAVYRECRYAALLVAGILHLWYSYAGPTVFLCRTFGTRMLSLLVKISMIVLFFRFNPQSVISSKKYIKRPDGRFVVKWFSYCNHGVKIVFLFRFIKGNGYNLFLAADHQLIFQSRANLKNNLPDRCISLVLFVTLPCLVKICLSLLQHRVE